MALNRFSGEKLALDATQRAIRLSPDDVEVAIEFALDMFQESAAVPSNFGDVNEVRDPDKFVSDHVLGKLAEVAVQRFFMNRYEVDSQIDWEIRRGHNATDDGNEFKSYIRGPKEIASKKKVDIKASTRAAQWLLVEESKMFKQKASDYYIAAIWLDSDKVPTFAKGPLAIHGHSPTFEIKGFAALDDLVNATHDKAWIEFAKCERLISVGDLIELRKIHRIYNPEASFEEFLRAYDARKRDHKHPIRRIGPILTNNRNTGLPYAWLRNSAIEWDALIECLLGEPVKSLDGTDGVAPIKPGTRRVMNWLG